MDLIRPLDTRYLRASKSRPLVYFAHDSPNLKEVAQTGINLPNEILMMIVDMLEVHDLLSLSATNKKTFNLVQSTVTDRLYDIQYNMVRLSGYWETAWKKPWPTEYRACTPEHLMLLMQYDPKIAIHIRYLEINCDLFSLPEGIPYQDSDSPPPIGYRLHPDARGMRLDEQEQYLQLSTEFWSERIEHRHKIRNRQPEYPVLLECLGKAKFLNNKEKEQWAHTFREDNERSFHRAAVVLCSMLPNLVHIRFSGDKLYFDACDLLPFANALAKRPSICEPLNLTKIIPTSITKASHLIKSLIITSAIGTDYKDEIHRRGPAPNVELRHMADICLIPSLEYIEVESVIYVSSPEEPIFAWPANQAGVSQIRQIVLLRPKVLAVDFHAFMRGLPVLDQVISVGRAPRDEAAWKAFFGRYPIFRQMPPLQKVTMTDRGFNR